MATVFREHLGPAERRKIYLILLFASLTLFFLSMWQARPVLVKVSDPLSLLNYLTPMYWAGLGLLLLASVSAFLDAEMKSSVIHILLLLALGLFLVGIVVFLYENTRNPDVYYPNSEVYRVVEIGHFEDKVSVAAYYSWPGVTGVNAATVLLTGMTGDFIQDYVKYMPLFWVLFFVLSAYAVGQRLRLAPRTCFLIAFLALASWWELNSYHSHSWGPLLYLLLFMLLIRPSKVMGETVAALLLFGALLITHATSSFMFFSAFILLALYRREARLAVVFVVLFGAWYTYEAWAVSEQGLQIALAGPFWQVKAVAQAERYAIPSVGARAMARYSQLAYLGLYVSLIASCVLVFLANRIPRERRSLLVGCFLWNIGVIGLLATGISPELVRFFLFCLIPAEIIIVLTLCPSGGRLGMSVMVALMLITVGLRLPAEYAVEAAWIQIPTSEVRGYDFFAKKVKLPHLLYLASDGSSNKKIQGADPRRLDNIHDILPDIGMWPDIDFAMVDSRADYVLITRVGTDSELFGYQHLTFSSWPQTPGARGAALLYDNGEFQVYSNTLRK